jgi:hypothetical protein
MSLPDQQDLTVRLNRHRAAFFVTAAEVDYRLTAAAEARVRGEAVCHDGTKRTVRRHGRQECDE